MIELQFFLQNAHFALNLFAALIFFAAAWLYFDAWLGRKDFKEGLKILGLFLLCLSFVAHSTSIEQTILSSPIFGGQAIALLSLILRIAGYIILCVGLMVDPLQKRPGEEKEKEEGDKAPAIGAFSGMGVGSLIAGLTPILAAFSGLLYLKRATVGLESHLKPVAFSFFILSLHELLSLATLFQGTKNVALFNIVAPFGPLWIVEHLFLIAATIILGRWVFAYLLKRLQTQLFMIFTTITLVIFLLTTVSFTYLLLKNLEADALTHLTTDANILSYSIESKKNEILSDAQVVASNPSLIQAVTSNDRKTLRDITSALLVSKKESFILITSSNGAVLMRGEDTERFGDSVSDDPIFKKTINRQSISSVIVKDGVLAPTVSLQAAVPIIENGGVIGAVMLGTNIDNSYVDGIKQATKLDASVYGKNIRSATTFIAADGKSRWVGIAEGTPAVKKSVLTDGKPYIGSSDILNVPYLSAYLPLKDINNTPVGMLFVGREKIEILQAAGRSIELTFIVSALLLILAIIPAFFISRYISGQVR